MRSDSMFCADCHADDGLRWSVTQPARHSVRLVSLVWQVQQSGSAIGTDLLFIKHYDDGVPGGRQEFKLLVLALCGHGACLLLSDKIIINNTLHQKTKYSSM